jgi:non-ribosomal peptide synthase protein (TIGR01720 family)
VTGRAPRTATESALCGLYRDVLGLPEVGIDDSFFELGGDSIVSIQLVAKARKAGLEFGPKDVFRHRTVAALAQVTRNVTAAPAPAPDEGTGTMPLTPVMHRWLGRGPERASINQATALRVPAGLEQRHLLTALQALLDHHDALRARLVTGQEAEGRAEASLEIPEAGTVRAENVLHRVDITSDGDSDRASDRGSDVDDGTANGGDPASLGERLRAETVAARDRLSPEDGVLVQAVWLDAGTRQPGRLLLVVHHLAVDGVSWRILLPDLKAAYEAVAAGRAVELEPVGTSLRGWARALADEAAHRRDELPLWQDILDGGEPQLGEVAFDPERDVTGTLRQLTLSLPSETTSAVLGPVPEAFHASANDILLTGLALAVAEWRGRTGTPGGASGVLLDLEGHGREDIGRGTDLSRTVGWFTSAYPVRLDPVPLGAGDADLSAAVKQVKEQLRQLPDSGIGYGLLRHLDPESAPALSGAPAPQIGFNYLGRFPAPHDETGADWAPAPESQALSGTHAAPDVPAAHSVDINAQTVDEEGGPVLSATWSWPGALLPEERVRALADTWFRWLEELAHLADSPESGGHTPSDLGLVSLSQDDIDQLEAEWGL